MSYSDRAGKTIEDAFGIFKVVLASDSVVPGDLLGPVVASDAWKLADEDTGPVPAQAIAMECGDTGDTITVCLACNIRTKPTCTAGVWAEVELALAADIGSPLYLSATAGKASISAGGTTNQQVGVITGLYTATLSPGGYLNSTSLTLSGDIAAANQTLSGTLAVTGVATFTGQDVHSAGIALAANKGLVYGGNSSGSATSGSLMPGMNVITAGAAGSYTLPAYAAGTEVKVANAAAAASITIIGPSLSCFNSASNASRLVSQAAANEGIHLVAVSATRYAIVAKNGSWNPTV